MTASPPRISAPRSRKDNRGRPATPFLKEKILQSASELFAEQEFDSVLVDHVAARAGVGKGSVYRQFGSKEELYAAAVINDLAQLRDEIRAALDGCPSQKDRIATIVRQTVQFFWSRKQFFALLRDPKALPRRQERQYRMQRQELARLVSGVLDDALESGTLNPSLDTRIAAEAMLGMLRGINRYCREFSTPQTAIATALSIFLDGCVAKDGAI
ncbi:MAG TPA: TetR/AcrR family transcriptional regulator [Candidatus Binataceae bacterium]|nr:TetR/AcrR family transcriptional regulator [Candidatus Binataceae bacterium]